LPCAWSCVCAPHASGSTSCAAPVTTLALKTEFHRPSYPSPFRRRNEFWRNLERRPAVAFGQARAYYNRLKRLERRAIRGGPSHDLPEELLGCAFAQVVCPKVHSWSPDFTVWVWVSNDRGPASGKGSRDSYRASQGLEGPPACRTACGLVVTQFSAQPLIFAAEQERLIAIATVEMSYWKMHGGDPSLPRSG